MTEDVSEGTALKFFEDQEEVGPVRLAEQEVELADFLAEHSNKKIAVVTVCSSLTISLEVLLFLWKRKQFDSLTTSAAAIVGRLPRKSSLRVAMLSSLSRELILCSLMNGN